METQEAIKQTAQAARRIVWGNLYISQHRFFFIRITGVIHHYKCFLNNFEDKNKSLEFSVLETYVREKQG